MKSVALAVLLIYNNSGSSQGWTVSGVMTMPQCEQVKQAVIDSGRPSGWSQSARITPALITCKEVM